MDGWRGVAVRYEFITLPTQLQQNSCMQTHNKQCRIQDTGYRIQNTEYRIQNIEYRIQNTETREHKITNVPVFLYCTST